MIITRLSKYEKPITDKEFFEVSVCKSGNVPHIYTGIYTDAYVKTPEQTFYRFIDEFLKKLVIDGRIISCVETLLGKWCNIFVVFRLFIQSAEQGNSFARTIST